MAAPVNLLAMSNMNWNGSASKTQFASLDERRHQVMPSKSCFQLRNHLFLTHNPLGLTVIAFTIISYMQVIFCYPTNLCLTTNGKDRLSANLELLHILLQPLLISDLQFLCLSSNINRREHKVFVEMPLDIEP